MEFNPPFFLLRLTRMSGVARFLGLVCLFFFLLLAFQDAEGVFFYCGAERAFGGLSIIPRERFLRFRVRPRGTAAGARGARRRWRRSDLICMYTAATAHSDVMTATTTRERLQLVPPCIASWCLKSAFQTQRMEKSVCVTVFTRVFFSFSGVGLEYDAPTEVHVTTKVGKGSFPIGTL